MADFHMQDMDIFEFMQRVRDHCLTRTPIILMAEDNRTDLVKEALKNGASLVFQKPLAPPDIKYLWQRLWPRILSFPGRQRAATTFTTPKKRLWTNSDDTNGKRRKSPNAQQEAGSSNSSNSWNKHWYYQSPSHQEKLNDGTRHNPNSVCYTLTGVEQIINGLNANNALDETSENVIMSTESDQVVWENGVENEGHQVSTLQKDGYRTDAFQIPNQEASNDLNNALNGTPENVIMNTGGNQVAGENGVQIFMEEGQVNTVQGPASATSPSDSILEGELTLDDISEIWSFINGEDV
ncbi:uncharacterized protein LOC141695182 [Apium graveolens]|uniref:uncharacterized protein LOC141695182 n=1 Tax=Apium graveolens TaxID=4045 RepID=UPI003D7BE6CD